MNNNIQTSATRQITPLTSSNRTDRTKQHGRSGRKQEKKPQRICSGLFPFIIFSLLLHQPRRTDHACVVAVFRSHHFGYISIRSSETVFPQIAV